MSIKSLRQSKLPIDIIFDIEDNFQQTNYDSNVKNCQKATSDAHKIINQNINKRNNNNKEMYNKKSLWLKFSSWG